MCFCTCYVPVRLAEQYLVYDTVGLPGLQSGMYLYYLVCYAIWYVIYVRLIGCLCPRKLIKFSIGQNADYALRVDVDAWY